MTFPLASADPHCLSLDVSRNCFELQRAADLLKIDEETIRQVLEGNQSPDIEDRPSYTRITTRAPRRTSQNAQLAEVDCIVGERWVVTVHDEPVAVLEDFRERANGSGAIGRLDGPEFLATLLEWVVGEFAKAFDEVEVELEELDVRALRAHSETRRWSSAASSACVATSGSCTGRFRHIAGP